jgi:hypothetical protein
VDGEQWKIVYEALKGAGVQSLQAKFDELFAVMEEVKSEKEAGKRKKGTARRVTRKPAEKSAVKKTVKGKNGKSTSRKKTAAQDKPA